MNRISGLVVDDVACPTTKAYVSRAGEKLDSALSHWDLTVSGLVCADLGCSTGGFVDCLLRRGAKKVYAVDTARGELDWKLRTDERVVVMEQTNALHVLFPEKLDFISVDVGWTKQEEVLPHALTQLKPSGLLVSLLKPQYELQNGGLFEIESEVKRLGELLLPLGFAIEGYMLSPIKGKRGGSSEYLLLIQRLK